MTYEEALTYLTAHGQQHLLRYYPTLTPAQQEHLLEQISDLHLERPQFQNREAAAQPLPAKTTRKSRAFFRKTTGRMV